MTSGAMDSAKQVTMSWIQSPCLRGVVAFVLTGIVVAACLVSPDVNTANQPGVVMKLPQYMGSYFSNPQEISQAEKTLLPADTEVVRRVYQGLRQEEILCSIVLAGGEKRSIHRPEVCLPGQGWIINSSQVVPIKLANGNTIKVTKLVLEREVQISSDKRIKIKSLYLYWFVGKNVSTPYHQTRVLLTSWDRLIHNINHRWAYVIVNSMVTDNIKPYGFNEKDTMAMLEKFTSDIAPKFMISEGAQP
jgi:hypothetical protein